MKTKKMVIVVVTLVMVGIALLTAAVAFDDEKTAPDILVYNNLSWMSYDSELRVTAYCYDQIYGDVRTEITVKLDREQYCGNTCTVKVYDKDGEIVEEFDGCCSIDLSECSNMREAVKMLEGYFKTYDYGKEDRTYKKIILW